MRRRLSSVRVALSLTLLLACGVPVSVVVAQTGAVVEGAPDLLLPTGARALGMGLAVAAAATGPDALWWNPALVARASREVAFNLAKVLAVDTDAGAVVILPVQRAFTVGFSVRYIDEGQQDATSLDQNGIGGTFDVSTAIVGASFAAPFGDRFAAGFTAKLLRLNFACTGACNANAPSTAPTTEALDLGAQYFVTRDSTLSVAAVVSNVGFRLQIIDAPQADPLPDRFETGALYCPKFAAMPPDQRVRFAADIITRLNGEGGPGYRVGGEWSWQDHVEARAGYVQSGPIGSGPTFGLGFQAGSWQIDLARMLSDASVTSGPPPTLITFGFRF